MTMSKLLIDAADYERYSGRSFYRDYVEPELEREREKQRRRCAYCGKRAASTRDHVFPKSRGGSNHESNLVWACRPCNSRKGARTPKEAGMKIEYIEESRVTSKDAIL